jgi:hypothetical protein
MIEKLPATVLYPSRFKQALTAGNDGVWDWSFLQGAFPRGITPMDIDAKVEISGHFLAFETKDEAKGVDRGQARSLAYLLYELRSKGVLLIIRGKIIPTSWEAVSRDMRFDVPVRYGNDCREEIFNFCARWGKWADKHPRVHDAETERLFRRILSA